MLQFYKTLVGAHQKYCVWFWSPSYRRDVKAMVCAVLPGCYYLGWRAVVCKRWQRLGLFLLEHRGPNGDLKEFYTFIREK